MEPAHARDLLIPLTHTEMFWLSVCYLKFLLNKFNIIYYDKLLFVYFFIKYELTKFIHFDMKYKISHKLFILKGDIKFFKVKSKFYTYPIDIL